MNADKNSLSPEHEQLIRALALDDNDISPDNRRRLSAPALRAFLRIAEVWDLTEDEQAHVLGSTSELAEQSRAAKGGDMIELPVEVLLRVSAVLGIYGAPRTTFLEPQRAYSWIKASMRLSGARPRSKLCWATVWRA